MAKWFWAMSEDERRQGLRILEEFAEYTGCEVDPNAGQVLVFQYRPLVTIKGDKNGKLYVLIHDLYGSKKYPQRVDGTFSAGAYEFALSSAEAHRRHKEYSEMLKSAEREARLVLEQVDCDPPPGIYLEVDRRSTTPAVRVSFKIDPKSLPKLYEALQGLHIIF